MDHKLSQVMESLNERHIEIVHDLILSKGVDLPELRIDLLDHICCMIEERMMAGADFNQALNKSFELFGNNELIEIQELTIYLLTQKQNKMKKVTGIIGIVASTFIILGVVAKVMHWQGASIVLVLGLVSVGLIVLPLMAYMDWQGKKDNLQKATSTIGYISAMLLTFATLFKLFHWPGGNVLNYIGFATLSLIFLPMFAYKRYKFAENKLLSIALSMIIFSGVFLFWTYFKL
jgi:hypothetical protein